MTSQVPQTLKGFRDFLPTEKRQRDWVEDKIVEVFERFGFAPIETPTLEYAELLTGKYGDEADKLIYTFTDRGDRQVGLRYDQTVPTARVLAQHQHQLPKYFRRYQLQNVFRADKPQKGRYREFRQCDIDIFGSTQPFADAEILACTYFAYKNIGFTDIEIPINDRTILTNTLAVFATDQISIASIITTIDKLDKVSESQVVSELVSKGLTKAKAEQAITQLKSVSPTPHLQTILEMTKQLGVPSSALKFNPLIARGLDYYTGMIFEVTIPTFTGGSVGGGGRYDNLIADLSGVSMPAVGMAFGFDRTVEAALEQNLVPQNVAATSVLVALFDEQTISDSLKLAENLRKAGIKTEVYPALDKLGKQFKYADQQKITFVALIGEEEQKTGQVTLKNLNDGTQQVVSQAEMLTLVSK